MASETISLWVPRQALLLSSSKPIVYFISNPSLVCEDANCRTIDTIFDIDISTEIRIFDGEKTPRFTVSNTRNQSIVLEASSVNEMMHWVLALRGVTFSNTHVSMANFKVLAVLGRGYYGKVMLCREIETNTCFAIKSVRKSRLLEKNKVHTIVSERNILTHIDHPFIISLKMAFQTPSKFYFVLEYAPGGELFYHLRRCGSFRVEQVKLYAAEIALALDHLHQLGIVYRDLKPENLLLDAAGHVKLTDFGLSKDLTAAIEETSTFCGTAEYLAPEIIRHIPYGKAVDWWMMGTLMFELLFGTPPFASENRMTMFKNICNSEVPFPVSANPEAVSLISRLLVKDPKQRATFKEIEQHPFFQDFPFDRVMNKEFTPEFVPEVKSDEVPANFAIEFTGEAAQDSFVSPVFGPLAELSEFSFVREEGFPEAEEPDADTVQQPAVEPPADGDPSG
jgi:serine/threonine protein kinase